MGMGRESVELVGLDRDDMIRPHSDVEYVAQEVDGQRGAVAKEQKQ